MSKLYECDYGVFISHKEYVDKLYTHLDDTQLQLNPSLFRISSQYNSNRKRKTKPIHDNHELLDKEHENIKCRFSNFMNLFMQKNTLPVDNENENGDALKAAEVVYNMSSKILVNNTFGANSGPATVRIINEAAFLFPKNSAFYSKDISEIKRDLHGKKYDLILLDPPWWNKYIRRKRKKSSDAYKMLYNNELKNIPINDLLKDDGMVVVWCTNSLNNLNDLLTDIFKEWDVHFCGKWYWLKVTTGGKPVCNFSIPPGKQPYEKIIFGCRKHPCPFQFDGKLVVSVPSAIHSHKPPLAELLEPFLPKNPACLEIFARYLLPEWTSYGNEVLKLQHESLFVPI